MPVFTDNDRELLRYELDSLSAWVNDTNRLFLTEEELALGWVQPGHLKALTDVRTVVNIAQTATRTKVFSESGTSSVLISPRPSLPFLWPNYAGSGMVGCAPDEVRQKVTGWLEERLRVGRMLSNVREGLYHLNTTCSNVRAMALLMPCLPSLMSSAAKKEPARSRIPKLLQQLPKQKAGNFPQLPVDVKQALAEASALVTGIVLMQADTPASSSETPGSPGDRYMAVLHVGHFADLEKHTSIFTGRETYTL